MGEEQEEEIWEEEGESGTVWTSSMHLFRVDFLLTPSNSSRVSSGHPFRLICPQEVESG